MKLLTLNCHAWLEEQQAEKIKIIAKNIMENQYDIIGLQEVNQLVDGKILYDQIKENNFAVALLAELKKLGCTGYHMIWECSHMGYEIYEEGLSILTRHPITAIHSFFVSHSQDKSFWKTRKIIGATLQMEEKTIQVYSCHLGWWHDLEEPFQLQVDQLLQQIKQDGLTLLLGDFNNNAFTRGEGYDYLLQQGLYDTYLLADIKDQGITVQGKIHGWEKNKGDLRLDLILANQKIKVLHSKVIFNGENQEVVSDHCGVTVEIR